ncbi:hypothetical protein [Parachlamydia sp. AcF125]|nr:hypothetical protein [Parachlamydia sp. AcF125]MBS4168291.1 hypothetical protein [Parachlamydia sp. AcF125]
MKCFKHYRAFYHLDVRPLRLFRELLETPLSKDLISPKQVFHVKYEK